MKRTWKTLLLVLTVLAMLFIFAACGEKSDAEKIEDAWNDFADEFEGAVDNIKDELNDIDLGDISGDIEDAAQDIQDAAGNIKDAAEDIKDELEGIFGGN